jgi:hypothetical protein
MNEAEVARTLVRMNPARISAGRTLKLIVIYFDPVPIRVLEIDLLYSVRPRCHLSFLALEVHVPDLHLLEPGNKILQ